MARHGSRHTKHGSSEEETRGQDVEGTTTGNGAAPGGESAPAVDEHLRRAEEMVDRFAERVGHYTGQLGHGLLRLAARAREEAEDIWADAQAVRRGES